MMIWKSGKGAKAKRFLEKGLDAKDIWQNFITRERFRTIREMIKPHLQ